MAEQMILISVEEYNQLLKSSNIPGQGVETTLETTLVTTKPVIPPIQSDPDKSVSLCQAVSCEPSPTSTIPVDKEIKPQIKRQHLTKKGRKKPNPPQKDPKLTPKPLKNWVKWG